MAGRVHVDLLISQAGPLEGLFAEPGHAYGQVEDLADRGALGPLIDGISAERVDGGDPPLPIGRPGQGDHGGEAANQVLNLHGVTDRINVGVGCSHMVVHDDALALADGQARFRRELHFRPHAHSENDQPAWDDPARIELHVQLAVPVLNGRDTVAEAQVHTLQTQMLVQGRGHLRIDRAHHLGFELHQRHREPAMHQDLRHLQADVSTANHNRGLEPARIHHGLDRVHVRQTAEGKDPLVIGAGDRRADRLSAGAQNQSIIRLLVLCVFGLVVHDDGLGLAIDADDLAAGADIDVESLPHRLGSLDQKPYPVLDDAADVVRQAAIGEGNIAASFKQNDLGVFADPPGLSRRRRPARHATHDHNPLTLTHTHPIPIETSRRHHTPRISYTRSPHPGSRHNIPPRAGHIQPPRQGSIRTTGDTRPLSVERPPARVATP